MSSNWIDGVWTGTGYQQEGSKWTIKFTADENRNEFLIQYPSLSGTGGRWLLLGKESSADRYTFQEVIPNQGHTILDGGRIIITKVANNFMSYSYFRAPAYTVVSSCSTLQRQ
jgi:hypothetical protein